MRFRAYCTMPPPPLYQKSTSTLQNRSETILEKMYDVALKITVKAIITNLFESVNTVHLKSNLNNGRI